MVLEIFGKYFTYLNIRYIWTENSMKSERNSARLMILSFRTGKTKATPIDAVSDMT